MQKKRRLFNIRVDEVSLVDIAANTQKFLIVKRGEKEVTVEEVKKILENIEKALNDLGAKIEGQEERIKALEPSDDELKKAGAKFSKATLAQLKGAYQALGKVLDGIDLGDEAGTQKDLTGEELAAGLTKGIKAGLTEEPKKVTDDNTDIAKVIEGVVRKVMEDKEKE